MNYEFRLKAPRNGHSINIQQKLNIILKLQVNTIRLLKNRCCEAA